MACINWNQSYSQHDKNLAHLFSASSGSHAIGEFYASPGMQPPPPSRPAMGSYFPVYQDSVFCGGYGYGCGYSTPGAFTASSVASTKKTSLGDAFHHYLVNGLAWNAPGMIGQGLAMLGIGANVGGNIFSNIANTLSPAASAPSSDPVMGTLTSRLSMC